MKRARAHALVLVNWNGLFYERFELDSHVTAFEGENGAGKTTAMIAAYVVLMPEFNRLRFTSLAEQGKTDGDKGIYGRLGEPPSPTYAAIDFRLPSGERLVATVHLERRAEPLVEMTPLLIVGLPPQVSLADVFLERAEDDGVPELARLRQLVALAGGQLLEPTLKDYFIELFNRGVTPLRLSTDDERSNFNEMLRTSMVGGISKSLSGGLRDFLLKEEGGLAETLKRMRENLDACRRTREEVATARQLETEISDVYEAGQAMFSAAVHATRARVDERQRLYDEAMARLAEATAERDRIKSEVDRLAEDRSAMVAALGLARTELQTLTDELQRTRRANELHHEREQLEAEREGTKSRKDAAQIEAERAKETRDRKRQERDRAQRDRDAAARGLADFKAGFADLERRAAEHQLVTERLDAARRALPTEDVRPEALDVVIKACGERISALDDDIVRVQRELSTSERQRDEFDCVLQALLRIAGAEIPRKRAFDEARRVQRHLDELEELERQRTALGDDVRRLQRLAREQEAVREEARSLEMDGRSVTTSADVAQAFEEVESELTRTEQRVRAAEREISTAQTRLETLEVALAERDADGRRWQTIAARVQSLAAAWQRTLATRADLDSLREDLQARRDRSRSELSAAEDERRRLRDQIDALEQTGGGFEERLLHARDHLEGELLVDRYEDVEVDAAGRLEAQLGPLRDAIVVEDAAAAARKLVATDDRPATVWLIGTDAIAQVDETTDPAGGDSQTVVVPGSVAWRVTRVPERPLLGRRARELRLAELRKDEARLGEAILKLLSEQSALTSGHAAVVALVPDWTFFERGDPSAELATLRSERERIAQARSVAEEARAREAEQATKLASRKRALTRLLPRSHLLDATDYANEARIAAERLERARVAHVELERVAGDRKILDAGIDLLRTVPLSDEAVEKLQRALQESEQARDDLERPLRALRYVEQHREALSWTDAEAVLQEHRALVPALDAQLENANEALKAAEASLDEADRTVATAVDALQTVSGALSVLEQSIARCGRELETLRVPDPSDAALEHVARFHARAEENVRNLDRQERALGEKLAGAAERLNGANKIVSERAREGEKEEKELRPARENWERLKQRADRERILTAALAPQLAERYGKLATVILWPAAQEQRAALIERLRKTSDGTELAKEVSDLFAAAPEQTQADNYLVAWLRVRDWLRRRVPAQIAEVDEPLAALEKLRNHLVHLEARLDQEEHALRGKSSDVARSIETQLRRARKHVQRLSDALSEVHFGSIRGVRIRVETIEHMGKILQALREGTAQELLFQSRMPIEQALDELFKRYGSGRTLGLRLLDYREYLNLDVEIQRQSSSAWEIARPNKMSTGEAIGVGASVMMVVLAAWEREANLLRGKRSAGSLRLLFLDEANRLSRDSLGTLFDLCEALELQLIIAAPEVARAEGNTTFHLERVIDASGRERVLVSGRRVLAEAQG